MTNGLGDRLARLIKTELSEFLIGNEPENLKTSQASYVEGIISDIKTRLGQIIAQKYNLDKELFRFQEQSEKLLLQAEAAVENNDDDMARQFISDKQKQEEQILKLKQDIEAFDAESDQLNDVLRKLSRQFD